MNSTTVTLLPSAEYTQAISRPDDAAADHQQFLRRVDQQQGVGGIHHAARRPRAARQLHRLRAGGDDALAEAQALVALAFADLQLVGGDEAAGAGDHAHLALLRHRRQAAAHGAHDLVLVRAQLIEVDLRRAEVDAEVGRVLRFLDQFGGMQQRLRRNAADIEADTA
jgi:hypothetical protein